MQRLKNILMPLDYQVIEDNFKDSPVDWDKVEDFAYNLDTTKIKYKSPYIRKAIVGEIDKGTFTKSVYKSLKTDKKQYTMIQRWISLEKMGIEMDEGAKYFIQELCDTLYNDYDISVDEIVTTNDGIIETLSSGDSLKKLYGLLRMSNIVKKSGIDLKSWEMKTKPLMEKYLKDWEELERMMG